MLTLYPPMSSTAPISATTAQVNRFITAVRNRMLPSPWPSKLPVKYPCLVCCFNFSWGEASPIICYTRDKSVGNDLGARLGSWSCNSVMVIEPTGELLELHHGPISVVNN